MHVHGATGFEDCVQLILLLLFPISDCGAQLLESKLQPNQDFKRSPISNRLETTVRPAMLSKVIARRLEIIFNPDV